jgi:dolichol-phosphate mannosyltransferase
MKTYVMIPTYNEKENIEVLIGKILDLKIKSMHILVVDDYSPDGTWKIVKRIADKKDNVHLLLRKKRRGRGSAGKDGFIFSLDNGADIIIEMDADMSHDPKDIPKLLQGLKGYDLVLGSRMVQGGREVGRSLIRRLITFGANMYIRLLLGINLRDCNSGYRCFKREVLEGIDLHSLESDGPSIVQEVLFRAHLKGYRIKEVPITFTDRRKGKSKLGIKQLANGYYMVFKLKLQHIFGYF